MSLDDTKGVAISGGGPFLGLAVGPHATASALTGVIRTARRAGSRRAEVRLACKILTTMTSFGMPDSVKVG